MDKPDPPKKRYTTTIIIDHHDGDHLFKILLGITMNDSIDWVRAGDRMPYAQSVGGQRTIRHVKHDDYVPEAKYNDALMEWHRATRKAGGAA